MYVHRKRVLKVICCLKKIKIKKLLGADSKLFQPVSIFEDLNFSVSCFCTFLGTSSSDCK